MKPAFKITADKKDVTALIAERLVSINITDETGLVSDTCEILLDNRDEKLEIPPRGAVLEVSLGYEDKPLTKMGSYIVDDVEASSPPLQMRITGKASNTLDKNLTKKYTQINGEIALCQKKNQQFNWHGDFVFEYRDIPDKYYLSDSVREYVLKSGTKGFNMKPEIDLQIARPILSSVHKMHRAGVDNYVTKYGKLRKLTPRECLRLMGFSDNFKIVVSDTRMYQQAGNSIVVNVLMEIIKNINYLY